jgi:hypothetical protein
MEKQQKQEAKLVMAFRLMTEKQREMAVALFERSVHPGKNNETRAIIGNSRRKS